MFESMSCPDITGIFVFPSSPTFPTGTVSIGDKAYEIVDGIAITDPLPQQVPLPFTITLNQNYRVSQVLSLGFALPSSYIEGVYPSIDQVIRQFTGELTILWPTTKVCLPEEQPYSVEIQGAVTSDPVTPPPTQPGSLGLIVPLVLLGVVGYWLMNRRG